MDQVQPVQIAQSDHDILLGLAKTVELQHVETIGKIEDIKIQVKAISDGTGAQLINHESRIQSLERTRDELAALKITDLALINNKKINRLEDLWKVTTFLLLTIGGVIGWFSNIFFNSMHK